MKKNLTSKSGVFCVDENGYLLSFEPHSRNTINVRDTACLRHLCIPEGVVSIGWGAENRHTEECLRNWIVMGDVTLPSSLRRIGEMALAYGAYHSLSIPATVTRISNAALIGCYIGTMKVEIDTVSDQVTWDDPDWLNPGPLRYGGRILKEAMIDYLYVKKVFPYRWIFREASIEHVRFLDAEETL